MSSPPSASPSKKRPRAPSQEQNDGAPLDATSAKRPCANGSDVGDGQVSQLQPKEEENVKPWQLPAAASGDPKKFVLCTVEDMPQPSDGYVLVTWVQQCASSSYPNSHTHYMIPSSEITASQWEKLVSVNNVIAGPLEPLDEYSSEDVHVLEPLLTHTFEGMRDPFIPGFLTQMKKFRLPFSAIPDVKQIRQFIITGCIYE